MIALFIALGGFGVGMAYILLLLRLAETDAQRHTITEEDDYVQ